MKHVNMPLWYREKPGRTSLSAFCGLTERKNLTRMLCRGLLLPVFLLAGALMGRNAAAQTVTPAYGAPTTTFNVCGASQLFTVELNGGINASGQLTITLPAGYVYNPNSHMVTSGGLTITQTSASNNVAVLQISNIPGGTSSFTYTAYAGCAVIGATGTNQVTYTLGSNPDAYSNAINAQNAKLNIVSVSNDAYVANTIGQVYTRAITIKNGGFGAVNQLSLTDTSSTAVGIGTITVSGGATLSVNRSWNGTDSLIVATINPSGGSFSPGDSVVVTETVKVLNCAGTTTRFNAWFGCTQACTQSNANGTATAGYTVNTAGIPNVTFTRVQDYAASCLPATAPVILKLKNTGSGIALLSNIIVGIGLNSMNEAVYPGNNAKIDTSMGAQLSYNGGGAWIAAPFTVAAFYNPGNTRPSMLNIASAITTLAAGDSVYIRFYVSDFDSLPCPTNGYRARYASSIYGSYSNACGSNVTSLNNIISPALLQATPSAIANIDAFPGTAYDLTYNINFSRGGTPFTTNTGYFDVVVTLPSTMQPYTLPVVATNYPLKRTSNTSVIVNPTSAAWDPVTRKLTLRYPFSNNLFNNQVLTIKTLPTCVAGALNPQVSSMDIRGQYGCATNQVLNYACGIQNSTTLHLCEPCTTGGALNFQPAVKRINYDIYSATDNNVPGGTLNVSNLRLDRMIGGDTVEVRSFIRLVTDSAATLSSFTHIYKDVTVNNANVPYITGSGIAYVYNAAGTLTHTITNIPTHATSAAPAYRFDIGAGTGAPASFNVGDSLVLVSLFRDTLDSYGPTAGTAVTFLTNVSASNTADASGLLRCDGNYTNTMRHVVSYLFSQAPTPASVIFSGCNDTVTTTHNLTIYSHDGTSESVTLRKFPFEIRNLIPVDRVEWMAQRIITSAEVPSLRPVHIALDSIKITPPGVATVNITGASIPAPVLGVYAGFQSLATYSMPGLNMQVFGDNRPFNTGTVFAVTSRSRIPCLPYNTPNQISGGYATIGHRMYASTGANAGSSYSSQTLNIMANALQPLTLTSGNANILVNSDTAIWEVQYTNSASVSRPNIWLAEATGINNIEILKVESLSGAGGTVTGNITPANNIYGLGNLAANTSGYYRITAKTSNCEGDTLKVAYDYDCDAYPASVAAGENSCHIRYMTMTIAVQPATVQTTIISQPSAAPKSLCDSLGYEVEVKNPALGKLSGLMKVRVQLPSGASFGGVAYEPNSAVIQVPNAGYPNGAYSALGNTDVVTSSIAGINFIVFTIPAATLAQLGNNEAFRLRFQIRTTPCSFVSGSAIKIRGEGVNSCGDPVASGYQQAQSIRIIGAPLNPVQFVLSSSADTVQACNSSDLSTPYRFVLTSNGPSLTDTAYLFRITLPHPWQMDGTAAVFAVPSGVTPSFVSQSGNVYTFKTGAGLPVGDSIVMTASLTVPAAQAATATCGLSDNIKEQATIRFSTTCITNGQVCNNLESVIAEREVTALYVKRPQYAITAATAAATGPAPNHNLGGTITLNSTNGVYTAQNGTLNAYKDVNSNGTYDAGDLLIGSQVLTVAAQASQVLNYDIVNTGNVQGDICPVVFTLDMNCACSQPVAAVVCNSIVLPIRFSGEAATVQGCTVDLSWKYETDNSQVTALEISRSRPGDAWATLAILPAGANSYRDIAPASGQWQYRIAAIDADKHTTWSNALPVTTYCKNTAITLFPNPAKEEIHVSLLGYSDDAVPYLLTDALGRTIRQGTFKGNSKNTLDISGIAPGLYRIRIVYAGAVSVHQLDIVK